MRGHLLWAISTLFYHRKTDGTMTALFPSFITAWLNFGTQTLLVSTNMNNLFSPVNMAVPILLVPAVAKLTEFTILYLPLKSPPKGMLVTF